jgi:hypothetical protein
LWGWPCIGDAEPPNAVWLSPLVQASSPVIREHSCSSPSLAWTLASLAWPISMGQEAAEEALEAKGRIEHPNAWLEIHNY